MISWLTDRDLQLKAVLQTHHHADHIGGAELLAQWPAAAVVTEASDRERIPFQTVSVRGGDRFPLLGQELEVIDVPAHTRAHIAFLVPEGGRAGEPAALFCGDTLFSAGCDVCLKEQPQTCTRPCSGGSLPDSTTVHCAHEYTEANLRWAVERAPLNQQIKERLEQVQGLRRQGASSLPSTIRLSRPPTCFFRPRPQTSWQACALIKTSGAGDCAQVSRRSNGVSALRSGHRGCGGDRATQIPQP